MKTFIARSGWVQEEGLRLDASAYGEGGLEARDKIVRGNWNQCRLDVACNLFTESRFARTYIPNPDHGVPYLTGSDMLLADLQGLLYLSKRRTPQMQQLLLGAGWTLISCSGTIGRTSFVRGQMVGMAASHDIIRAVPNTVNIQPGYLFAFLSSAPAQAMIRQRTYGSVIQHIEPSHIADLPVPLPDEPMQLRIHQRVQGAADARSEASRLLDEAARYFDRLAGPMPSTHEHAYAAAVIRSSRLNLRLDAFHHVGWSAEGAIKGEQLGTIADVAIPGRMKLVHADHGTPFFTGIDIYQLRPNATKRIARWLPGFDELAVHSGTLLMQVDGQRYGLMGRPAYAGRTLEGAATSWHMARIIGEPAQVARVFAFAQSGSGRRAILRQSFGTSVPSISADLLKRVRIPALPQALIDQVIRAFALREQADEDEDRAIREVEAWLS